MLVGVGAFGDDVWVSVLVVDTEDEHAVSRRENLIPHEVRKFPHLHSSPIPSSDSMQKGVVENGFCGLFEIRLKECDLFGRYFCIPVAGGIRQPIKVWTRDQLPSHLFQLP